MLQADRLDLAVEVPEVPGPDVHRAEAEADVARVDPVEVHVSQERRPQGRGVVVAQFPRAPDREGPGGHGAGTEHAGRAEEERHGRAGRVLQRPHRRNSGSEAVGPRSDGGSRRDLGPERVQAGDAVLGGVPGDDGGVDRPDRGSGDPVGARTPRTGRPRTRRPDRTRAPPPPCRTAPVCGAGLDPVMRPPS